MQPPQFNIGNASDNTKHFHWDRFDKTIPSQYSDIMQRSAFFDPRDNKFRNFTLDIFLFLMAKRFASNDPKMARLEMALNAASVDFAARTIMIRILINYCETTGRLYNVANKSYILLGAGWSDPSLILQR